MTAVGIVMGSTSDWETMKAAAKMLEEFGVAYEAKAMSAHRTPHAVVDGPRARRSNGMKAIIAAAGGAAHLAGVVAAHTTLPVLGVPMPSQAPAGPGFAAFHRADAEGHSAARRDG